MHDQKQCHQCGKTFSKPVYNSKLAWSKRQFCSLKCVGTAQIGRKPPKSAFKKGSTVGTKNINWKGDSAGYGSVHQWVSRYKQKPSSCENCGVSNTDARIEWSNKDHLYRRNLDDYEALCSKCHWAYHKKMGFRR